MELRPGYKKTEVGAIPEDWEALPASQVGRFRGGTGFPLPHQGLQEGEFPFYKVSDMNNEGNDVFMVAANNWISDEVRRKLGAHAFTAGSIVFAKVGAAIFLERKKILSRSSCIDNNMAAFVLNEEKASVSFIHSQLLTKKLGDLVATTALPSLSGKVLGEIVLTIPPLPEQSAIASALSDADALLSAQDALIAKKRAIKQGAMQELLTGKRRLPGFSGEWEVKRLGRLLESPVTDGPHLTPKFLDRGVPFLSVNNLVDGRIDWTDLRYISDVDHREFSRKCRPRKGDILFGKAASVGMVAFVETEIEFNIWSPIALIRVAPQFSAKFVYRQLQSGFVEKQVLLLTNSSSQGNIGMGDIERLEIAYPSSREEQVAIAALLDDLDYEITALEIQRAKTAQLKQGMMQALLTGRIRLV